jgi:WD40 repeat protein
LVRLQRLLGTLDFFVEKVETFGPQSLIDDFDLAFNAANESPAEASSIAILNLKPVREAVLLSEKVLMQDASYLPGQLLGRLQKTKESSLAALIKHAKLWKQRPWLRPLYPSLMPAGGPLIAAISRHNSPVTALALTPDGQYLVSADGPYLFGSKSLFLGEWADDRYEKLLIVWEWRSRTATKFLRGHAGGITCLIITADGKHAISSSVDKTIIIWNIQEGTRKHVLRGHEGVVSALALTKDGRRIISASEDKTIKLWDLESGKNIYTLERHTSVVTAVTVLPDEKRAVSASFDRSLHVWDIDSGEELLRLNSAQSHDPFDLGGLGFHWSGFNDYRFLAIATLADGSSILSLTNDDVLRTWDVEKGEETGALRGDLKALTTMIVSPDGKSVFTSCADITNEADTIQVRDLQTSELTRLFRYVSAVRSLAVTPDGKQVISGSEDKTIRVWDVQSDTTEFLPPGHFEAIKAVSVTPDGLYALSAGEGETRVWSLKSGTVKFRLQGQKGSADSFAVTPDGKILINAPTSELLRFWSLQKRGEYLFALNDKDYGFDKIIVTPDSRFLLIIHLDHFVVWDLKTRCQVKTLYKHDDFIDNLAVTPDGSFAVSASQDETLKVWDIKRRKVNKGSSRTKVEPTTGLVSADGLLALKSVSKDHQTDGELFTLRGHKGKVSTVDVSPDGALAVSGSEDCSVRVWDIKNGKPLRTMRGHEGPVKAVVTLPTGIQCVSAAEDGTLRVWDLQHGEELLSIKLSATASVLDETERLIKVTRDGKRVVSAVEGNMVKVFDLSDGRIIASFYGDTPFSTCDVTPDGQYIIAGERTGRLHLLRLEGA